MVFIVLCKIRIETAPVDECMPLTPHADFFGPFEHLTFSKLRTPSVYRLARCSISFEKFPPIREPHPDRDLPLSFRVGRQS